MKLMLLLISALSIIAATSTAETQGDFIDLGILDDDVTVGKVNLLLRPLTPLEKKASRYYETLWALSRRMFKVGAHPLPILEPYTKATLPSLKFSGSKVSGNATLKNLLVSGVQGFKLSDPEVYLHHGAPPGALNVQARRSTVRFPKLEVYVEYAADVILEDLLPMHITGTMRFVLSGLVVHSEKQFKLTPDGKHYKVEGLHVKVHADDVKQRVTVNEYPAANNNQDLLVSWFKALKHDVLVYLTQLIVDGSDRFLHGYTNGQVMAYLVPEVGKE